MSFDPRHFLFACLLSLAGALHAQETPRERLLMDGNWRFYLGDAAEVGTLFDYPEFKRLDKHRPDDDQQEAQNASLRVDAAAVNLGKDVSFVQAAFDDSAWRRLDLPHDWAVELPFDKRGDEDHGFKAMGPALGNTIGWYRREFDLPVSDKGRALWVEFDGVYRNCVVWLNGVCLGRNVSGYSSFSYDISKAANYGGRNTLVVRVDATRTEGWFYEGAGIYRHVWLVKTGPVHIEHWGTFVTSVVNGAGADVSIATTVVNSGPTPVSAKITSSLLDAEGKPAGEAVSPEVRLGAGEEQTVTQKVTLKSATLWSLENPYLYRLASGVETGGGRTDRYETPFGIRAVTFDPDHGFFLNGKHVYIQGTCNHQDAAGVGSAVPDRLAAWRLEQLKGFGCNAYRTAHHMPAPELLDAADRLGMLVLDEHRRTGNTPEIMSQIERLVRRDRNHPSVIAWCLGNEEMSAQGNDKFAATVLTPMQNLANRLDPTRLTTFAMNTEWGKGFSKVIEMQGFNYRWNGMKARKALEADPSGKKGSLDMDLWKAAFPGKPALGTEEASTVSTRGIYENDKKRNYVSAYDRNLPRWGTEREWGSTAEGWWNYYLERPWAAGAFVWTGFDYRGEPTPYGWPNISSHFGIMDACGFPKDNYYYYKAWWSGQPVLHILPHWNWPGKEGQNIEVWVHSNYDAVELVLNGTSLGKKVMPRNSHLEWQVAYAPGALEARGYKGDTVVATEKIETSGGPAKLTLTPDRPRIDADGQDVAVFTVSAQDAKGRPVPTADNLVKFEIHGAQIIGVGNGDPSCHESDKGSERSLFNGFAQVIVQAARNAGPIELTARAEGLDSAVASVQAQPVPLPPSLP